MARAGCFTAWRATASCRRLFAKVHPRFRTPHLCTIIIGVVGAAIAAIFPLDILADLVSIGTLLAFISVCVGIMILRISAPKIRANSARPMSGSWRRLASSPAAQ